MREINIITDSSNDLTKELLEKHDIRVMPIYVNFGEDSYRDGVDIDTETLYKKISAFKELPKTSAIPPSQFIEVFSKYPEDEDIIFLGIGSGFSSTFNNARLAAEDFDNVYLIDSFNLSSGVGLQLLKLCKFREQGVSASEIVEKMKSITPLVKTQFAINTLEYLHMGGRCSSTKLLISNILSIKPIIRVLDGKMEATKKPLGFIKALNAILSYVDSDKGKIDEDCIMITHSMAADDAVYLRNELIKRGFNNDKIIETKAGGTISTHCGPRTIGILYLLNP